MNQSYSKKTAWPEELTPEMEQAFFDMLPLYSRDEVDHPNDTGIDRMRSEDGKGGKL